MLPQNRRILFFFVLPYDPREIEMIPTPVRLGRRRRRLAPSSSSQSPWDVWRRPVKMRDGNGGGALVDRDTNWVSPRESLRNDSHFSLMLTLRKNTDTSHFPPKEGSKVGTKNTDPGRQPAIQGRERMMMMTTTNVPSVMRETQLKIKGRRKGSGDQL